MKTARLSKGRGQSLTEMAFITPIMVLCLLSIIEFSGAYMAKMKIESAAAQGTRIGALEGVGQNCSSAPLADAVDLDIINAILGGNGVDQTSVQSIQVFRVLPDGSSDPSAVNTYSPPFTQTVSGVTVPYSTTGNFNWPPCTRQPSEPSDSVGIHISYRYHPIVSVPGFSNVPIDFSTVQHINPPTGSIPCPIPGIADNVTAAVASPQPAPSSNDRVTWGIVPGAASYNVYNSVNGAPYSLTPVANVISSTTGTTQTFVYTQNVTYAPASYEVAGVNYCGTGQHSLPAANGQCGLPVTPVILGVSQAVTPSTDAINFSAPWPAISLADSYVVTQTTTGATQSVPVSAGDTVSSTTTMAADTSVATSYKMAVITACGVVGSPSNTVTRAATSSVPSTGTTIDNAAKAASLTPGKWTFTGTWTHCTTCSPTVQATNLYSNTASYSSASGDTAIAQFPAAGVGTHTITLYGGQQNDAGKATVTLDSGTPQTVDFYSASAGSRVIATFSVTDASSTSHKVTVKVLGSHSSSSTGNRVFIDAVNLQ